MAPSRRTLLASMMFVAISACASAHPPASATHDRELLTRALTSFNEANALSQPPEGLTSFRMTQVNEEKFRRLLSDGLAAGDSVSDAYLDSLDPAMRHYFRDFYMKGQHMYQEGMLAQNVSQQAASDRLIATWYNDFWRTHGPTITDKLLAE